MSRWVRLQDLEGNSCLFDEAAKEIYLSKGWVEVEEAATVAETTTSTPSLFDEVVDDEQELT